MVVTRVSRLREFVAALSDQRIGLRLRAVALLVLLASVGGCHLGARGGAPDASSACAEVSMRPLVLDDGRLLYVEPAAAALGADDEVLLLGWPTYAFTETGEGPDLQFVGESNPVLGALIPREGPARAVPLPVPDAVFGSVRALGRTDENGGWDVVMAEVPVGSTFPFPDSVTRLWHGVYDGHRWTRLDEIPLPRGGVLRPNFDSDLVRHGDGLAWAMTMRIPDHYANAVVFERHSGEWSHTVIETRRAAQAALGSSSARGLTLAVVQPDTTLPSDVNSLFFYTDPPIWTVLGKVLSGGSEPVYVPSFTSTPAGLRLHWLVESGEGRRYRHEARTLLQAPGESVVTVDSSIAQGFVPLVLEDGSQVWITDHLVPRTHTREVRVLRDEAGGPEVVHSFAYPFDGTFTAVGRSSDEVLLVGGKLDTTNGTLGSLLIEATVTCESIR